jgi:hypothetical protein
VEDLLSEKQKGSAVRKSVNIEMKNRGSRIYGILILLFFISLSAYSQRKSDIGFFGGTSYYMGDMNPSKHFHKPGYAFGPIYRYNFEPRNSIRISAIYHTLEANTVDYGDPFVETLGPTFEAAFIETAANYEFNFVPYKTANRKLNKSLYLTAGVATHYVLTTSTASTEKFHISIPFGIGYKVNIAKKLSAGAEVTVRKTFNDKILDGIVNVNGENINLFGNNDWYTFAGIFISYKIFNYREDCPAYD